MKPGDILGRALYLAMALPVLALAALALPAMTNASQAAAQDGQVFKDWRIRCLSEGTPNGETYCAAEQITINKDNNQPVLLIRAHHETPDGSPVAVIFVPLLVRLPPGLRLEIDKGPSVTLPFILCAPNGCMARIDLKGEILAGFKKGIEGKVVVQVPPGREVATPFSLRGFTAGLAAVKK